MPAKSISQQHFMGMVHAYKQGKLKHASAEIKKAAASISDEDAVDFASTKHKKLPNTVKEGMSFKEFLLQEQSGD